MGQGLRACVSGCPDAPMKGSTLWASQIKRSLFLTMGNGAGERSRTSNLLFTKQLLCQLSYTSIKTSGPWIRRAGLSVRCRPRRTSMHRNAWRGNGGGPSEEEGTRTTRAWTYDATRRGHAEVSILQYAGVQLEYQSRCQTGYRRTVTITLRPSCTSRTYVEYRGRGAREGYRTSLSCRLKAALGADVP